MSSLRPEGACRKFSLQDGLIVIMALALGFAGYRGVVQSRPLFETATTAQQWASEAHDYLGFPLGLSSLLILGLRLRKPRPQLRRLACQPGAAASFAMVLLGLGRIANTQIHSLISTPYMSMQGRVTFELKTYYFFHAGLAAEAGYVVAITWLLLVMGGRWRPEPGWIDRAGRVLGWCWIAWSISGAFTG